MGDWRLGDWGIGGLGDWRLGDWGIRRCRFAEIVAGFLFQGEREAAGKI